MPHLCLLPWILNRNKHIRQTHPLRCLHNTPWKQLNWTRQQKRVSTQMPYQLSYLTFMRLPCIYCAPELTCLLQDQLRISNLSAVIWPDRPVTHPNEPSARKRHIPASAVDAARSCVQGQSEEEYPGHQRKTTAEYFAFGGEAHVHSRPIHKSLRNNLCW